MRSGQPGSLRQPEAIDALFGVDILGDDLEEWMAESSLIKRTFRNCAVVAGLIERAPAQSRLIVVVPGGDLDVRWRCRAAGHLRYDELFARLPGFLCLREDESLVDDRVEGTSDHLVA